MKVTEAKEIKKHTLIKDLQETDTLHIQIGTDRLKIKFNVNFQALQIFSEFGTEPLFSISGTELKTVKIPEQATYCSVIFPTQYYKTIRERLKDLPIWLPEEGSK